MSTKRPGGLTHNPLLTRTEPAAPAASPPTADDGRVPVDMQTRGHADTPAPAPPVMSASELSDRPEKFTFYFTPEQLERLDDVWEQLRRHKPRGQRRPSKSRFVRVALDRLLDDFHRDPEGVMQLLTES